MKKELLMFPAESKKVRRTATIQKMFLTAMKLVCYEKRCPVKRTFTKVQSRHQGSKSGRTD